MQSLAFDKLKYGTPLHDKVLQRVRDRFKMSQSKMAEYHTTWDKVEEMYRLYVKRTDEDSLRKSKRDNEGSPQYVTLNIPYSYAIALAAHTYWHSVFLSRNPILQLTGRHGESQQQVQAFEALLDYQVSVGGMLVPLDLWGGDMFKYGLGIVGAYWAEEDAIVSTIVEVPVSFLGVFNIPGKFKKEKQVQRVKGYRGNKLFNVRPQDFFPDPRVPLVNLASGEFCGRITQKGWNYVLQQGQAGRYFNLKELDEGRAGGSLDRTVFSDKFIAPASKDEMLSLGEKRQGYPVELAEMIVELVPRDWEADGQSLGSTSYPEKWAFTIADGSVVIGAQPLGAYHNQFGYFLQMFEMEPHGHGSRGVFEITEELNKTMSWLFNCYDAETEVLTERGWVAFPLLRQSDAVATVDPETRAFWFEVPSAHFEYDYDGEMVQFDSKRYNACVTPNHLMYAKKRYNGSWDFSPAASFLSPYGAYLLPGNLQYEGEEQSEFVLPGMDSYNHKYPAQTLSMDTWLEFLGYFCCGGCVPNAENTNSYPIKVTQTTERAGQKIYSCVSKLPWNVTIHEREKFAADVCFHDKALYYWLRENVKTNSYDVRVPAFIFDLSRRQLQIFWDACMRADGSTCEGHENLQRISSVSKKFIDDLQIIALKLGYSTLVFKDINAWRLSINRVSRDASCTQRHNVRSVKYTGKVYCFTNSTHLTVTRRAGRVMIAGQSHFFNVRKALNDQLIVDPSRINMKDILDGGAGKLIRVRPEAYGMDVRTMMTQLAVMDVTASHIGDAQVVAELMQRAIGANDSIMGMLSPRGRKTAAEVRTATSFGVNRMKTVSEYNSALGWAPLTQVLIQNTQQHYDQQQMFRIAGDLLQPGMRFLRVAPEDIAGSYDLVPVDGTMPIDRMAQANLWKEILVAAPQLPAIAAQYDWAGIFAWMAQVAGLKNISQFKVKMNVLPDQVIQDQLAAGKISAIPGGTPAAGAQTMGDMLGQNPEGVNGQ